MFIYSTSVTVIISFVTVTFVIGEDPPPAPEGQLPPLPPFPYHAPPPPLYSTYPHAYGPGPALPNSRGQMNPMMTMIMMMSLMSDTDSDMSMMLPIVMMMMQQRPGADSNMPLMMMLLMGEDGFDKDKMLPFVVLMMSQAGDDVGANNIRSMTNAANMFQASGHPRPQF